MQKVGLILDANSFQNLKKLAIKAEKANLHSIWATELYRTSFQQLSVAASVTEKINIGSAVSLAFTRSPLITSLTSLDIDEISNGRLILGLGTGAKRTNENFHSVEYEKPITKIKECVTLLRELISKSHSDEEIIFDGKYYNLNTKGYKRPFKPIRTNIPIYLAGIGKDMIRLSAEISDGYIGHVVCSYDYIKEVVIPSINIGLDKRQNNYFTISSIITCAISDDVEQARMDVKGTIAFYALVKTYRPPFELHGFLDHANKIRECYFNKDVEGMKNNVTEEMVDTFAIVGTREECIEKVDNYRKYIDLPILSAPHYFIDFNEVMKYQDNIINTFGNK